METAVQLVTQTPTIKGTAEQFRGDVYISAVIKQSGGSRLNANLVRFTPGARNHWHSHARGQTLHCVDGQGVVVSRDGTVILIRPGDTVYTPPGEEHWHGALANQVMSHYALYEGDDDGDGSTWLAEVTEAEYATATENVAD